MKSVTRRVPRRLAAALAAGAIFAGMPLAASATTFLRLYRNESKIVRVDGLKRVSVTSQAVATPVIISPSEVMVNGLTVGRTSMYIWDVNGRTEIMVVVRPFTEELQKKLEEDINDPDVDIKVVSSGDQDQVFLRGTVGNMSQFRSAETVAAAYVGTGNVVNLLEVTGITEDPLSQLTRLIDNEAIDVQVITEPQASNVVTPPRIASIILQGYVDDQRDMTRAVAIARSFVNNDDNRITNLMEVVNPLQVMVEGHLLELTRTEGSQTGVTWGTQEVQSSLDPNTGLITSTFGDFKPDTATFLENFLYAIPRGTLGGLIGAPNPAYLEDLKRVDPVFANLQWQLATGKGQLLHNPTVVTRSGEQAEIFVGGDSAAITAGGFGTQTATFRQFGLRMQVTPNVDHKGNIQTAVNIELSNPDNTLGATLAGSVVPGFRRRTTTNNVTVKDGEHIIISGLINKEEQTQIAKVPLLWKLPVLGRLFQNKRFQQNETELVIVITPHLLASKRLRERFYQDTLQGVDAAAELAMANAEHAGDLHGSLRAGVPAPAPDANKKMVREMFAGMQGGPAAPQLAAAPGAAAPLAAAPTAAERAAARPAGVEVAPPAPAAPGASDPAGRIRAMLEARRSEARSAQLAQGAGVDGISAEPFRPGLKLASGPALGAGDPMAPPDLPGLVPVQGGISSRIHGMLAPGDVGPAYSAGPGAGGDEMLDRRVDQLFDQIKSKLEGSNY